VITGLHHVAVAVRSLAAGIAAVEAMLGRPCARQGDGFAWFPLANTGPLLTCAADETPWVAGAGFAVGDAEAAARLVARRGLSATAGATPLGGPAARFAPNGLDLSLVQGGAGGGPGGIGLDHLVIRTANPDRAVALFGGRLGLDLRLDRSTPEWGTRFLFFRCGDLVVEVTQKLGTPVSDAPDAFSGLALRAADMDAEHARLAAAGLPVSEMRKGRKPGTRIFTLRAPAALVPTVFIGP
jgi:catechol 2,3-dioxygenase-like lactoylglutathione lyase family enzyme